MGLDLRFLPFEGSGSTPYSHSVLSVCRCGGLFDAILAVEKHQGRDVPQGFTSFLSREGEIEETHYGVTTETPYGEPIKEVQAKVLKPFHTHPEVIDSPRNQAVWAYLECLPDDTSIALFWH